MKFIKVKRLLTHNCVVFQKNNNKHIGCVYETRNFNGYIKEISNNIDAESINEYELVMNILIDEYKKLWEYDAIYYGFKIGNIIFITLVS